MKKTGKAYTDEEHLRVIVETPYKSRVKFSYDKQSGLFNATKILPDGLTFPFNMGFIPSTEGEDGDGLDAIVLLDEILYPGCVIECRLIGVLRAKQKERGKKAVRNDRFICVAKDMQPYEKIKKLSDLGKKKLKAIASFFKEYNSFENKAFEVLEIKKSKKAHGLIKKQLSK